MQAKKEINVQIGQEIKQAREKAKMTQEEFAEAVDVSVQYVSNLERGIVGVSLATFKRICTVLSVSSDRILFGSENTTSLSIIGEKCKPLNNKQMELLSEIVDKYVEAIYTERYTKENLCEKM